MPPLRSVSPGLPRCPVVKNPPASARDMGLILGLGRSHVLQAAEPVSPSYRGRGALGPELCRRRSRWDERPTRHSQRKLSSSDEDPVWPKLRLFLKYKRRATPTFAYTETKVAAPFCRFCLVFSKKPLEGINNKQVSKI